jgi:phage-related protein
MNPLLKPVEWISSSREDLREFPEDVQQVIGFALYRSQLGKSTLMLNRSKDLRELVSSK